MKQIALLFLSVLLTGSLSAQVRGNANYMNQVLVSDKNINIGTVSNGDLTISVKGLANVKADAYVAIFSVTQTGKTTDEVNGLIDVRINQALDEFKEKEGVETYIDMISFVPVYAIEVENKIFSKKTYNEIPAGFEIKKNIHVKYSDPDLLNGIIAALARSEIYDLVKVDYYANDLESVRKELSSKARATVMERLEHYEELLAMELDTIDRMVADDYRVVLPIEMYKSNQAYYNTSLNLRSKADAITAADKVTTQYYQPVTDKEFDFILNPVVFEPVVQVMYEVKLTVRIQDARRRRDMQPQATKEVIKVDKEFYFVTPNGDVKKLGIN